MWACFCLSVHGCGSGCVWLIVLSNHIFTHRHTHTTDTHKTKTLSSRNYYFCSSFKAGQHRSWPLWLGGHWSIWEMGPHLLHSGVFWKKKGCVVLFEPSHTKPSLALAPHRTVIICRELSEFPLRAVSVAMVHFLSHGRHRWCNNGSCDVRVKIKGKRM